ncbi:hypothetical protein CHS0354_013332 [Potamilus streckersoni]|uniref:Neurotransmitter-gated ion-channel ligand-binding domain-containing protein n=1 Tax=Potamilus streckersoni TaxID=2493646 RepID=A0AAE0W6T2_9BIVA|nr:hypothetical protein CHS0354_013332 [Potamilus streckersoni]
MTTLHMLLTATAFNLFQLFFQLQPCFAVTGYQANMLYTDLMASYNERVRPVQNQDQVLTVSAAFNLISILELEESIQKLSIYGYFMLSWKDEFLVWNASKYGNLYSVEFPEDEVWRPVIVLSNGYGGFNVLGENFVKVTVKNNGTATWNPGDVFESTCFIDITYYPFDTQVCDLHFLTWSQGADEVKMKPIFPDIVKSDFQENGEWRLLESWMRTVETYSQSNSGEKISFSVTVYVAYGVYLSNISSSLPHNSLHISALTVYLICMLGLSVIATFFVALETRYFFSIKEQSLEVAAKISYTNHKDEKHINNDSSGEAKTKRLWLNLKTMNATLFWIFVAADFGVSIGFFLYLRNQAE